MTDIPQVETIKMPPDALVGIRLPVPLSMLAMLVATANEAFDEAHPALHVEICGDLIWICG